GSATTSRVSSRRSSGARRGSWASRSRTTRPTRSPGALAARRASPTASSAASATSPRSGTPARSRARSRTRRSSCSRSTRRGWSAPTATCSRRSCTSSAGGRWVCRRWPSPSARSRTRSRTCTSPTSCSSGSSSGRRAGGSSPTSDSPTSRPDRRRGQTPSSSVEPLGTGLRWPAGRPRRSDPPPDRAVRRRRRGRAGIRRGRARRRRPLRDRVARPCTGIRIRDDSPTSGRGRPGRGDRPDRLDQANRAQPRRRAARRPGLLRAGRLARILQLVPAGHGRQLEQGAAAARVAVGELGGVVVPGDLEQAFLDAMVEPGAAEDQLAQPVDERFALDEGNALPVPNEIPAERAPRLVDSTFRGQLDQVGRLVVVELVRFQQPELDGGCRHALLEVGPVEAEPVPEKLDDVVVSGRIVGAVHPAKLSTDPGYQCPSAAYTDARGMRARVVLTSLAACAGLTALAAWALDWSFERAVILAPVVVAVAGAAAFLVVLWTRVAWESIRGRRER